MAKSKVDIVIVICWGTVLTIALLLLIGSSLINNQSPNVETGGYQLIAKGEYVYKTVGGGIKTYPYIGDFCIDDLVGSAIHSVVDINNESLVEFGKTPVLLPNKVYSLYKESFLFYDKYVIIEN